MRIGIDVRKINDTGIGRYIRSLLKYLLLLDKDNQYCLFVGPRENNQFPFKQGNIRKIVDSAGKYSVREHISLSWKAYRYGIDLFHAPHYVLPLALPCKSVVTIHDLIHLIYPLPLPLNIAYLYARFIMAGAIKKARIVLTGSVHTKNDLMRFFPTYCSKIRVIPYGVGEEFVLMDRQTIEDFIIRKGIPRNFFLYVGDRKPHKNLSTLIDAFSTVVQKVDCYLIIAGEPPGQQDMLLNKLLHHGINHRVIFSGHIPDPELPCLYNSARALVFPSLYEGFGFPPLEAMACGTPVICSHTSSLPEIVGDNAILLPPKEVDLWAEAMYNVFTDKELEQELRKKGIRRAGLFSWQETALQTYKVYQEILSKQ
jgi:glycosyltransferase involved in cell wall biosynthesis